MEKTKKCYKLHPRDFIDDIPVFSENDHYIENYDRISRDHLDYYEKTGHNPFMNEDHWREIEASTEVLVRRYINKSSDKIDRILDVGVGMGRLLENFPSLERFGMDISRGYLRHAKSKGIEVCLSRIEDMPYHDEYFDIVISTDVLEHVLDLNLAIKKILATLKHDGILIVRVPYREDLSSYLSENYPYDLVHLRNFDESSLRLLFEKIFRTHVLEYSFAGYQGGGLRFISNNNILSRISMKCLSIVKSFHKKSYIYLTKKLCRPVEINLVIRKSKSTASS